MRYQALCDPTPAAAPPALRLLTAIREIGRSAIAPPAVAARLLRPPISDCRRPQSVGSGSLPIDGSTAVLVLRPKRRRSALSGRRGVSHAAIPVIGGSRMLPQVRPALLDDEQAFSDSCRSCTARPPCAFSTVSSQAHKMSLLRRPYHRR